MLTPAFLATLAFAGMGDPDPLTCPCTADGKAPETITVTLSTPAGGTKSYQLMFDGAPGDRCTWFRNTNGSGCAEPDDITAYLSNVGPVAPSWRFNVMVHYGGGGDNVVNYWTEFPVRPNLSSWVNVPIQLRLDASNSACANKASSCAVAGN